MNPRHRPHRIQLPSRRLVVGLGAAAPWRLTSPANRRSASSDQDLVRFPRTCLHVGVEPTSLPSPRLQVEWSCSSCRLPQARLEIDYIRSGTRLPTEKAGWKLSSGTLCT